MSNFILIYTWFIYEKQIGARVYEKFIEKTQYWNYSIHLHFPRKFGKVSIAIHF